MDTLDNLSDNRKGILMVLASSVLVCFGQLCWKQSALMGFPLLLLGFLLYIAGAFLMIIAYRYGELSVLQPILATNYVLAFILAAFILNEDISLRKIMGCTGVIAGVILLGRKSK